MLQCARQLLNTLHGPSVHIVANQLNGFLSPKGNNPALVNKEKVKEFLRNEVMPIFEGTCYDSAIQAELVKKDLCLLCREAAYAAALLEVNPSGKYVQNLLTFIIEDEQRMDFLKRLTTTQACKIIEYLTYIRLSSVNLDCFRILVSRLNFKNLHNIARVMFCFGERGYAELNITVILPAYPGEKWSTKFFTESPRYSPAAEAVRTMRALSKSTRIFLEKHFPGGSASPGSPSFPWSSFHLFRNNLVEFIISNPEALRGAHWVNFSRALLNFPPMVQHLEGLDSPELLQALCINGQAPSPTNDVTCAAVAEYAIGKVFSHVEEHERQKGKLFGSESQGSSDKEKNLDDVREAFDCNPADLLKLLRQLTAFPTEVGNRARIQKLVNSLIEGISDLSFANTVKLLTVVRSLPSIPAITAMAPKVAKAGGRKLLQKPPKDVLRREKFEDLVQFAVLIYACRIKVVPEFLEFLRISVHHISPKELTLEYVVAFLNALSVLDLGKSDGAITLNLVGKVLENTVASHPLLASHPEESVKLFRAFALQAITPPVALLTGIFGSEGVSKLHPKLSQAGAVTVFDISRSLSFTLRRARDNLNKDLEELAWGIGVKGTVLPLIFEWSEAMRRSGVQNPVTEYVPLTWRCVFETLGLYLDVILDYLDYKALVERVTEVYELCKKLLLSAAACTGQQVDTLRALPTAVRNEKLDRISFKNNSMVHFLSALLSFEYYIHHAAWQESQWLLRLKREEGATETGTTPLARLLQDYHTQFLHSTQGNSPFSPMKVVEKVLNDSEAEPKGSNEPRGDAVRGRRSLLSREQTIEITTHLPFALSLVITPGPVNEYFMEQGYADVVAGIPRS